MRITLALLSLVLALFFSVLRAIPIWQTNLIGLELAGRLSDSTVSPYECAILRERTLGLIKTDICRTASFELKGDGIYLALANGKLFSLSDKQPLASLGLGAFTLQDGQLTKAIEYWKSVENSELYLLNLARKDQDPYTQIELYELSIMVKPQLITFVELSKSYAALGDYDAAIRTANSAIEIFTYKPTSDDYFLALVYQQAGHAYYSQKDYQNAMVRYEHALGLWTDLPESIAGLARIELISGQYDSAIESLLSGLESVGNKYWINYWLAVAYHDIGNSEEASRRLSLALEERQSFAPAWRLLGKFAEENGDRELAIEAYQNYLVLFPDDIDVANSLKSLERQAP